MPDYYLISETADIKPDDPIRGWSKCSVSRPIPDDMRIIEFHQP